MYFYQFSLRDLLALIVVAAVGLLLLMLALPVITREVPRRAMCMNHELQVGRAILSTAVARDGEFVGYRHELGGSSVSWPIVILPAIGRNDIYDLYVTSPSAQPPGIDIYICPQDLPTNTATPHLSYVINAGRADDVDEKFANGIARDYTIFEERLTLNYIAQHDGTATTILLSENRQATTWDALGKLDTTFLWHSTTSPKPEHRINGNTAKEQLTNDTARPSSNHASGVVATFCDGHTQFINEQIEYRTYMQLMTPSDKDSDMPKNWRNMPLKESQYK